MKKTLLFLVGHCMVFISNAGIEESNTFTYAQYGVLASFMKNQATTGTLTQTTNTNDQQILASSPASVSCIDEMMQQPIESKKQLIRQRHVFLPYENKVSDVQKLTIRRPISLEDQEAHALGNLLRSHSSQNGSFRDCPVASLSPLKDCPTPDLGKSPLQDCLTPDLGKTPDKDCLTPDLGNGPDKDCPVTSPSPLSASNSAQDCIVYSPSPETPSHNGNDLQTRLRSYSNASEQSTLSDDFFLGSVSSESPRASHKR